ncbi:S-layer homology domain-containing protein [Paenibacillus sp. N4]|uniref:S-layer homology domain-containing protein n=1 Tax=Paenibacillus vietnamensis TaxID=2590547 RepID=UPI001CD09583|nr:S-layer homology domain-containing protein [Paenibacillus vietnamensis]MCA0753624.1 S-layer homology domain-containing protein [Paenibacillus vietnamensis]
MGKTTLIAGAVTLLLLSSALQAFAYDARLSLYKDVPEKDWAAESVYRLSALGVIDGYGDNTYRPGDALTREAFVKLLVQSVEPAAGKEKAAALQDVAKDRWSYEPIKKAYDAGWLDALTAGGKFKPAQSIKREEVAALIAHALLQNESEEEKRLWFEKGWLEAREQADFGDMGSADAKLAPYVMKAYSESIMLGDTKGNFLPAKTLTRREAAVTIDRLTGHQSDGRILELSAFDSAGGPYKNYGRFASADEMIFDWANLNYEGAGHATAALKLPADYKQALSAAEAGGASKTLMVFGNTISQKLGEFVMDREAHQAFADSLGSLAADPAYGFDGVTIDFEGLIPDSYREPFIELLRTVKFALGDDIALSVAVPPSNYYDGFDYEQIGGLADRVILMAYDFTHAASGLPSAPLTLVGDSVRDILEHVPADKLMLGISKQANQWTTKPDGTVDFFRSPAIAAVESRIADPGTKSDMPLPFFLNRLTFTDNRGSHLLWYEDAKSIEAKLRLARDLGLRGAALWQINQLTDTDWTMISSFNE